MNTNSVHFCFNDYGHLDVSPALAGLWEDIQLKRDTRLKTKATIILITWVLKTPFLTFLFVVRVILWQYEIGRASFIFMFHVAMPFTLFFRSAKNDNRLVNLNCLEWFIVIFWKMLLVRELLNNENESRKAIYPPFRM